MGGIPLIGLIIYEDISTFLCSLILPAAETFKYRNEIRSFMKYAAIKFKKTK
jgi:hypothetical protein